MSHTMEIRLPILDDFVASQLDWKPKFKLDFFQQVFQELLVWMRLLHKLELLGEQWFWFEQLLPIEELHLQANQLVKTHCLPDYRIFQNRVELCKAFKIARVRPESNNLINRSTLSEVKIVSGQNEQTEILLKSSFNLCQMV